MGTGGAAPGGAASSQPPLLTAAQFPNDQPVKRLWGVALRVSKAGDPPVSNVQGVATASATWPRALAYDPWPKAQAQGVLVVELLAGAMVIVGLLTRPAALALAGVMLGAMWLDQCTPAIQSGKTILGVFPSHEAFDVRGWMPLAWQGALLGACVSLAISGAGRLSLDAIRHARRVVINAPTPQQGGPARGRAM